MAAAGRSPAAPDGAPLMTENALSRSFVAVFPIKCPQVKGGCTDRPASDGQSAISHSEHDVNVMFICCPSGVSKEIRSSYGVYHPPAPRIGPDGRLASFFVFAPAPRATNAATSDKAGASSAAGARRRSLPHREHTGRSRRVLRWAGAASCAVTTVSPEPRQRTRAYTRLQRGHRRSIQPDGELAATPCSSEHHACSSA